MEVDNRKKNNIGKKNKKSILSLEDKDNESGYSDDESLDFQLKCDPCYPSDKSSVLSKTKNDGEVSTVPWDEICLLPLLKPVLSWDNVLVPVPYRFDEQHTRLALGQGKGQGRDLDVNTTKPNPLMGDLDLGLELLWKIHPPLEIKEISKPQIVTRDQFFQSGFHLLAGRSSTMFPFDKNKAKFKKNEGLVVKGLSPSSLKTYAEMLLECGNIVRKLEKKDANCYYKGSLIDDAFTKFVNNYLEIYQTILMLNAPRIRSFMDLLKFVKPLHSQLEIIDKIWHKDNSSIMSPVDLLSHLNWLMLSECTPWVSRLVQNVFVACASVYLRSISDWIFRGTLPERGDFHIQKAREQSYKDRRFWSKQFVQLNGIPLFLKDSAVLVFETGKAVSFLKQIQKENVFSTCQLFAVDEDLHLQPVLTFDGLETLFLEWNEIRCKFRNSKADLIQELERVVQEFQSTAGGFSITLCVTPTPDVEVKTMEDWIKERQVTQNAKRDLKRLKQLEFREQLDKQIVEAEAYRRVEAAATKLKDQKDVEYQIMREKRDFDEEKRIRLKHFGEDTTCQRLTKNFFQKMHKGGSLEELLQATTPDGVLGDPEGSTGDQLIGSVESSPCPTEEPGGEGDKGAGDAELVIIDSQEISNIAVSAIEEILFNDDKLDPDKIITDNPPPYATSHINFDSVDANEFMNRSLHRLAEAQGKSSVSFPPHNTQDPNSLNLFLSQSITIPVSVQYEMVNLSLLQFYICEKKLLRHVEALNNFLCLQNGLFGRTLTELLIEHLHSHHSSSPETILTAIVRLNDILSQAISISVDSEDAQDHATNLAWSLTDVHAHENQNQNQTPEGRGSSKSTYDVLNNIMLCYNISWPLNVVLTDELMHQFERLFVFQMRLNRAELLLEKTFLNMKNAFKYCPQVLRVHNYRSRLMHFVRSTKNYVNVTVIQPAWNELISSFDKIDSLDKIYESLVRYIKTVNTNCLLGAKAEGVLKLLINQLTIVELFCRQLNCLTSERIRGTKNNSLFPSDEFKKLTQKFKAFEEIGKLFIEVAYKLVRKGYYPKVSYFLELYDFNGYFKNIGEQDEK